MKMKLLFSLLIIISLFSQLRAQIPYPGEDPGKAAITKLKDLHVVLENNVIRMEFVNDGKKINLQGFNDKKTHEELKPSASALFELILQDSTVITSDDFRPANSPVVSDLKGNSKAIVYAERLAGKKYSADLENKEKGIYVNWEAELRDGSNYVRQIFRFKSDGRNRISRFILVKLPAKTGIKKEGVVDGSPIVFKNMFFAIEHPMSQTEERKASLSSYIMQLTPVTSTKSVAYSTVWGTTPPGQLRRGFLYYTERERSNHYHQMLHYNSWYDISWDDGKFTEYQALERMKMYRDSLIIKRHVHLNAFLFDDGWDDNKTLWRFNQEGFPNGFKRLREFAYSCKSSVGVWMSPFGGYGPAKEKRLEYGKNQNPPFETNANGFTLAGPVYYNRFLEVTKNFIKDYNISMFKFDGVGPGNDANGAGIAYNNDIEAFLRLLKDLKVAKPDLYLDLTTGTWPSPYWLMYGDNIWRSGEDFNRAGEGSDQQRAITYRDAIIYKNVVKKAPLYPLNALMNGGIIIAKYGLPEKFSLNDKDISDDIWSFFASGVSLQELYINPHYLNSANWDCLAKASNWARENEPIMADIHWIGGNPAQGEVYGYAAWSNGKAVLSLRNPSKVEKTFEVNVSDVFELPVNVSKEYIFYDVKSFKAAGEKKVSAKGRSFKITLQPFEVKVFNALSQ